MSSTKSTIRDTRLVFVRLVANLGSVSGGECPHCLHLSISFTRSLASVPTFHCIIFFAVEMKRLVMCKLCLSDQFRLLSWYECTLKFPFLFCSIDRISDYVADGIMVGTKFDSIFIVAVSELMDSCGY